jgi:hypothetical protein
MISFKFYLSEERLPFDVIARTVDDHLKRGEIMKKDYENLKYEADRNLENEIDPLHKKYFHGRGGDYRGTPLESADDVFYYGVHNVRSIPGKLKRAAKLPQNEPMVREYNTQTNEIIDREMTDQEYAQYKVNQAEFVAEKAEAEAKEAQRQAILDRLGITSEEARLLLGS